MRNIEPVTVPITTQPIMILGPSMDGLGISVAISWVLCCGCGLNDGTFDHVGDAVLVLLADVQLDDR